MKHNTSISQAIRPELQPRQARPVTPERPFERRLPLSVKLRHGPALHVHARVLDWGPRKAPALLVQGGISANAHLAANPCNPAPGWWSAQVGRGRSLDPRRHRLIAVDWLGGDAHTPWPVDTADQADLLAAALDALHLPRVEAFIGCSYGGCVALQFAHRHPQRLRRALVISAADRAHPMGLALRLVQRRILALTQGTAAEAEGVSVARQLAMLTYRSEADLRQRIRQNRFGAASVEAILGDWLAACGARHAERFDAASCARLSSSLDGHWVDARTIHTPVTLVGVKQDWLVPLSQLRALRRRLPKADALIELDSVFGHDAFIKAEAEVGQVLQDFLGGAHD